VCQPVIRLVSTWWSARGVVNIRSVRSRPPGASERGHARKGVPTFAPGVLAFAKISTREGGGPEGFNAMRCARSHSSISNDPPPAHDPKSAILEFPNRYRFAEPLPAMGVKNA